MHRFASLAVIVALSCVVAGCASRGERVATNVEAVATHDFNPTDLQTIGTQAVDKLLAKNAFPESDKKPVLYVSQIRNMTDEHVNTAAIQEYVAVRLGDSGKVQLTGVPKELEEATKVLEFQQGAMVDPSTAQKVGKMIGAQYFVQGELANMTSRAGWSKGQYFLFTLTLVHVETMQVWKSQVEIQKVSHRGLFGW